MDKTIVAGPLTLLYREEGKGLPVLLLHGFGEDGEIWRRQMETLSADYRVLVPDLPGSGRSSALTEETSMEKMAEQLLLLLDQENIQRCVLIGHSMGGYIALAFAEKFPERLCGLGLFHSTSYPDTEEKKAARQKSIGFIRNNGAAPFIRQSTPNLFAAATRDKYSELVENTIRQYSDFSPDALIYYYEAMIRRPDRRQILENFSGPVLFVIGMQDQLISPEHMLQQSHLPSLSHIQILGESGHLGMLEEPDHSSRILQSFLNFVTQA